MASDSSTFRATDTAHPGFEDEILIANGNFTTVSDSHRLSVLEKLNSIPGNGNAIADKFGYNTSPVAFHTDNLVDDVSAGKNHNVSNSIDQGGSAHFNIPRTSRDGPLVLSYAQQRLWFLAKIGGVSGSYHVHRTFRLQGTLDIVSLQKALDTLYARHESLRCRFPAVDGQPTMNILPAKDGIPIVTIDVQEAQDKDSTAKKIIMQEAATSFDVEQGPLVRAKLIQLGGSEYVFSITIHHIVTDGWSMGVLFREINELYKAHFSGVPEPLAPLSIQYPDYAAWQRQQLIQDKLKNHTAFWRETLAGAPIFIELPTDRPRPPRQSFAGASIPIRLDSQLTYAIKSLSQRHGVTVFMTVLAAWSVLLSRLSRQDDIVVGTPSASHRHQQVEQLIGFFVSIIALRIDLSEEPTVSQLLERVCKATIAGQTHQDLPFEQVVEVVQPPSRADITPLFQVLLAWQSNDEVCTLKLPDIEAAEDSLCNGVARFELEMNLSERNGEIAGELNYSTALFDRETIDRHVGYLEAMLRWMMTSTEESITKAPILGPSERELLLETWNRTDQPYPDNACLHQLFENQVELSPEAIVIVQDDQMLTYRELNSRANVIARQLVDAGVKPGDYVMLLLDRSIGLVASEIAVLKTGAAYVPVDTKTPDDRQASIASDCESTVMVTDESTTVSSDIQGTVIRVNAHLRYTDLVQDFTKLSAIKHPNTSSQDTAYVMYTSGSTGQPKGVMVSHRGIVNLITNSEFVELSPEDGLAFMNSPSFDPSTYDVWAALAHGARIVVIDKDTTLDPYRLAEELVRRKVTIVNTNNGLLHQYAYLIGDTLSRLKYLIAGSEQGSCKAYSAILQHGGRVRLDNQYGPTETTVSATSYTATGALDELERLPIGRPISNTRVYVLDKHHNPVPIGVVGELYIGGHGVANGYLNRPELTAERFLPDPFTRAKGARMYRTGDLVRYLPDGNLVFVGRNDNQVKIRGFRIELGEIEARLAEHPQVHEAVVLVADEGSDNKRLVSYVVAEAHDDLVHTLRSYLSARLPEYMVPSAFVRMDAFPLTINDKIDRRALPKPNSDSLVASDYIAPEGDLEIALAMMWADLLNIERVGRHDNFFLLGGHSLLAVRMISAVRENLGVELKLHMLFSAPTLAELVPNLDCGHVGDSRGDEFSVLIPLKPQGSRPPLFCIHPALGLSWSYRGLIKYLHSEQPLYGLQARGVDGKSPFASSIEEMTMDYIHHIRTIQPHGPYHLLGRSFGGAVAQSMASELQKQGESVPLLVIMDVLPGNYTDQEMESPDYDEQLKFDEYVARLVGDTMTDVALKKLVARILENSARLLRVHTPPVYHGDCLFIRAIARKTLDAACWIPYIRGKIEIFDVDCTHDEMEKPEHVAVAGGAVAAWIEKLQSRSSCRRVG